MKHLELILSENIINTLNNNFKNYVFCESLKKIRYLCVESSIESYNHIFRKH